MRAALGGRRIRPPARDTNRTRAPGAVRMNRRDFLLMRPGPRGAVLELKCEQLYMRYVDARLHGSTRLLMGRIQRRLQDAGELRMTDTAWLCDQDLRRDLDELVAAFRARGGRVRR